jgi:hypothetical protein
MPANLQRVTAFEGHRLIASGGLTEVALKTKEVIERGAREPVLVFDDATSRLVELDLRGTPAEVRQRMEARAEPSAPAEASGDAPRGPGRPKLGVVAREVTLLPRHWDWLNAQPGGASVALRKLVEEARRVNEVKDRLRSGQEVTYRFMSALAGDLPQFEEATRALFAGDRARFEAQLGEWPEDVRAHTMRLAETAFPSAPAA